MCPYFGRKRIFPPSIFDLIYLMLDWPFQGQKFDLRIWARKKLKKVWRPLFICYFLLEFWYRIWTGSPKHLLARRRRTCLPAVDDALLVGEGLGGGGLQPGAPSRLPNPRAPEAAAPRGRRIPIQVVGERVAQPRRNILLAQRDAQSLLFAGLAIKNPPKKTQKTTLKNPLKMFFFGFFGESF